MDSLGIFWLIFYTGDRGIAALAKLRPFRESESCDYEQSKLTR